MTYKERMKVCRELEKYAELEGTEIADVCRALIGICESSIDYVSAEFAEALDKEIVSQLNYFKDNFEIVEEMSQPIAPKKYKVLREKQ